MLKAISYGMNLSNQNRAGNRQELSGRQEPEQSAAEQRPEGNLGQQRRYNPRLVFADPDSFFIDLLMEQEEP